MAAAATAPAAMDVDVKEPRPKDEELMPQPKSASRAEVLRNTRTHTEFKGARIQNTRI